MLLFYNRCIRLNFRSILKKYICDEKITINGVDLMSVPIEINIMVGFPTKQV